MTINDARIKENRLEELRLDNDLKQKEIAKELNISGKNYSDWERGVTDIPLEKSNVLANYYDCSLDYLFGLSNVKKISERKTINLKLLSDRLLEARKENNLTQEQLSSDVGYHQRTYAHYENGSRIPTTFKVFYIALYHNISLDYLTGKSDIKEIIN